MASAAEQLAANLNWGTFSRATELKKRLWFTLGALLVYRLGTYIPVPGINLTALNNVFAESGGGVFGMFDMLAGGALRRMTVFALNIMPYISASIIMQLMSMISPQVEALRKEGERGRQVINQYTRYLTVVITILQAYGVAVGLESINGAAGAAVADPGVFFRFTTVTTLVGGTLFLMWLGEQMTERGIGNGISLIIFSGIVANLPSALVGTLELGRTGALSPLAIAGILVMVVAITGLIVVIERAQRRIPVQYPRRQHGNRLYAGDSSHLPLKINTAGVIPPIFASSILLLPVTVAGFSSQSGPQWLHAAAASLGHGQPLYMLLYAVLTAFFTFFYTAVVFNPKDTADNLKKNGGFVPGIRPGNNTEEYLDFVLTRLSIIGAIYLVIVSILPELLISKLNIPFYFGGTSLLIVVTVTMDTVSQVQSHMLAHQYEHLIRKSAHKGKRAR